jgi:ribosomal protein S18 acetylase RimI-like enzyme
MLQLLPSCLEDDCFLFEVYMSTRVEEFTSLGWDEDQLASFLRMQYEMQKRSYHNQYPNSNYELVVWEGVRVGRIMFEETEQAWMLVDIALLPIYRNKGIGTQLIVRLQQNAALTNKPIRLFVLAGNPVQELYKRLGFHVTGQQSPYIAMEWMDTEWSS